LKPRMILSFSSPERPAFLTTSASISAADEPHPKRRENASRWERKNEKKKKVTKKRKTKTTSSSPYPSDGRRSRGQKFARSVIQEATIDHGLHELGVALVAEGATKHGVCLGDGVVGGKRGGVTVRVSLHREGRVDEDGLGALQEILALHGHHLALLEVLGGGAKREQHTLRAPAELVAKRVVGALWGREATTVGEEGVNLASLLVDVVDHLEGVKVVNARIDADLVHDGDASILGLLIQLPHERVDIARGDHVFLELDGRLDHQDVKGPRNQAATIVTNFEFEVPEEEEEKKKGVRVLD